jgi:uncharacterized protein (TIGR02646 family)
MRWIRKKNEPQKLQEWRLKYKNDPNFGYSLLRQEKDAIDSVHSSLLMEQGYLCAYTGLGIDQDSSHIEHVTPQAHCEAMETVAYTNIVACCPGPNQVDPPYGAKKKDHWPSPEEAHLFVSPLNPACDSKFIYTNTGKIKPTFIYTNIDNVRRQDIDIAAQTTIGIVKYFVSEVDL